jgi:two-component system, NarL family, response regulator DesR
MERNPQRITSQIPAMNEKIRILCVDDNVAISESLRFLVAGQPDLVWVGCLTTADDLPQQVRELRPSVMLLDIGMPGRSPWEAMHEIAESGLSVRTIVLSGSAAPSMVDRAMDAGAWGFVPKHDGPAVLLEAIRRVAAGEVHFDLEV